MYKHFLKHVNRYLGCLSVLNINCTVFLIDKITFVYEFLLGYKKLSAFLERETGEKKVCVSHSVL